MSVDLSRPVGPYPRPRHVPDPDAARMADWRREIGAEPERRRPGRHRRRAGLWVFVSYPVAGTVVIREVKP